MEVLLVWLDRGILACGFGMGGFGFGFWIVFVFVLAWMGITGDGDTGYLRIALYIMYR